MKSLYLLVDFFTVIIPLLFSFHPKIKFYKTWKSFFTSNIIVTAIFVSWDAFFTRLGVWHFNPRYITGVYFFNLPAEELLFFICIPFACVFTYYCLDQFYELSWKRSNENIFCLIFFLFLVITGFIFSERLYTSVTFISTAFVCLFLQFIFKINWFGKAVSIYTILLIPFFIVNGILTGTGLAEPVVVYNKDEMLGLRLLSIPIEDVFYGFEMILLNIYLYKIFQNIYSRKEIKLSQEMAYKMVE